MPDTPTLPGTRRALPEVVLNGCKSAFRQQYSRKAIRRVPNHVIIMVPLAKEQVPLLKAFSVARSGWSPGYVEWQAPVTSRQEVSRGPVTS